MEQKERKRKTPCCIKCLCSTAALRAPAVLRCPLIQRASLQWRGFMSTVGHSLALCEQHPPLHPVVWISENTGNNTGTLQLIHLAATQTSRSTRPPMEAGVWLCNIIGDFSSRGPMNGTGFFFSRAWCHSCWSARGRLVQTCPSRVAAERLTTLSVARAKSNSSARLRYKNHTF